MTYREHVQKMIADVEKIYDKAGSLRDAADETEKDAFNTTRRLIGDISLALQRLDRLLPKERAEMEL